jgi:hypothetical protein
MLPARVTVGGLPIDLALTEQMTAKRVNPKSAFGYRQ